MSPGSDAPGPASSSFWRTARGRHLLWLLAATAVLVGAFAIALLRDTKSTALRFEPEAVFPNFEQVSEKAAAITIADKTHATHVTRAESGAWSVAEAHGYAASERRIRSLFIDLAFLRKIEPKTASPELQASLGLVAPDKGGEGTSITVADRAGRPLARLLVGRLQPSGGAGEDRAFIRANDAPEAYLAEGRLPLDTAPTDWVEQTIVDLPRDRVKRVVVTPADGPAYAIARATEKDVDFALEAPPPGRVMASDNAANGVGAAAVNVTLDDVKPLAGAQFAKPSRITYETFDGLVLTFEIATEGDVHWARVSATAPAGSKTEAEAQTITARTQAWAYALPEWKANLFTKPLESLLKSEAKDTVAAPR